MTRRAAARGVKPWVVFISHHGDDAWVAKQIAREIRACGAEAFLSEEIEGGEDFPDVIRKVLRNAKELVALLTPWAFDRPFVWAEIGAAWAFRRRLTPVLHGQPAERRFQTDRKVPVFLKRRNFVRLNDIDSGYLTQLRDRLRKGK